jgi:hypothetical protein
MFSKEEENSNSKKVYCRDCCHNSHYSGNGYKCYFKLHKIYDTFYDHVDSAEAIWDAKLQNAQNDCPYYNIHDELNPIKEDKNV